MYLFCWEFVKVVAYRALTYVTGHVRLAREERYACAGIAMCFDGPISVLGYFCVFRDI